ncbi:hypothetical protein GH733_004418 [Mirounga leonina]|nr:hypothetical protein GH733_004418 [Mirounga leonina]
MLEVHIPSVGPEDPRQSPEKGHMVFRVEVLSRGRRHTVQRRYSEFHALHKRVRLRRRPTDRPRPGSCPAPARLLGDGRTAGPASATITAPVPGGLRSWAQTSLRASGWVQRGEGPACTVDAIAWPASPRAFAGGTQSEYCDGTAVTSWQIKKLYKVPDFPSKRLPNWRTRGLEQRRQGLEAYIQELLEFLNLRHFPTDPKASSWGSQLHHRPVFSFHRDPYIRSPSPVPYPFLLFSFCPTELLPNVVVNGVLQGLYGCSNGPAEAQPEASCHPAPLPPMP